MSDARVAQVSKPAVSLPLLSVRHVALETKHGSGRQTVFPHHPPKTNPADPACSNRTSSAQTQIQFPSLLSPNEVHRPSLRHDSAWNESSGKNNQTKNTLTVSGFVAKRTPFPGLMAIGPAARRPLGLPPGAGRPAKVGSLIPSATSLNFRRGGHTSHFCPGPALKLDSS